jgi:hypothetical protein
MRAAARKTRSGVISILSIDILYRMVYGLANKYSFRTIDSGPTNRTMRKPSSTRITDAQMIARLEEGIHSYVHTYLATLIIYPDFILIQQFF